MIVILVCLVSLLKLLHVFLLCCLLEEVRLVPSFGGSGTVFGVAPLFFRDF